MKAAKRRFHQACLPDPFGIGAEILIDRTLPARPDGLVEDQHGNLWREIGERYIKGRQTVKAEPVRRKL